MYAAALPMALSYVALWNPPHWDHKALFYYLLGMAIVIRGIVSFYEVPSSALAAEFSTSYDERSVLLSYRYFFAWVGGLAINLLAFAVLLRPDATHKVGQLNPIGYAHYGLVASAVIFIAILVSTAGTHRYIPQLMPPPPRRHLTPGQILPRDARVPLQPLVPVPARLSGSPPPWRRAWAPRSTTTSTPSSGVSAPSRSRCSPLGVFLSAIIALPAAPTLSRRFGKRSDRHHLHDPVRDLSASAPLFLRLAGLMPPNGSPALVAIIFCTSIITTTFIIVAQTMGSSMVADVVEAARAEDRPAVRGPVLRGLGVHPEGDLRASASWRHRC